MVKNTVTLQEEQQAVVNSLADKNNCSKVDVFRKLVDVAAHGNDLDEIETAVKTYKSVSMDEYHPFDPATISLDRSELRKIGSPVGINPEHVSRDVMPQSYDDKAMVIYGMMLFRGNFDFEKQKFGSRTELINQYVGTADHMHDKVRDGLISIHKTFKDSETFEYWSEYDDLMRVKMVHDGAVESMSRADTVRGRLCRDMLRYGHAYTSDERKQMKEAQESALKANKERARKRAHKQILEQREARVVD